MPDSIPIAERVGGVETSVRGLHVDFAEMKSDLREIKASIHAGSKTNWPLIVSVVGLGGVFWAAAIQPQSREIERTMKANDVLAQAVLLKDQQMHRLEIELEILKQRLENKQ